MIEKYKMFGLIVESHAWVVGNHLVACNQKIYISKRTDTGQHPPASSKHLPTQPLLALCILQLPDCLTV